MFTITSVTVAVPRWPGGTFSLTVKDGVPGNQGTLRRWCVRVNGEESCTPDSPLRIPLGVPLRSFIEVDVDAVDSLDVEAEIEHPDPSELTVDLEHDTSPGVEMQVWDGFAWQTVAANDARPDQPRELRWTSLDEEGPVHGVGQLLFGATREDKALNLRLKSKHPSGARPELGEVAADYLEVRLRYVVPPAGE